MPSVIRNAEPSDYLRVTRVVDEWWGGRQMAAMLPKLFFVHFRETSFVAESDPATRGSGLGRELYERFFAAVAPRTVVRAVTSPVNERSVAFHRAIGFEVERVDEHYDGPGEPRVLLVKRLVGSS